MAIAAGVLPTAPAQVLVLRALGLGDLLTAVPALRALGPGTILTHHHPDHPELAGAPWRPDTHEIQRWCALLQWARIPCDPDDLSIERPPDRPDRRGVIVIHPGASAPARRWPAERFAQVAAALHDAGHQVVITGSAAERTLAAHVAQMAGLPADAVLAGDLDLLDLVALISDSRLVLCGDTGVAHLVTATGTPSVLLFGPTPPSRWGPPTDAKHVVLWAGDCGDPHADRPDRGLLLLTVQRVLGATTTLLACCP